MLLLSVLVAFIAPCRVTNVDPGTIARQAVTLAQSKQLEKALCRSRPSSVKELCQELKDCECHAAMEDEAVQHQFAISMVSKSENTEGSRPKTNVHSWCNPYILSP